MAKKPVEVPAGVHPDALNMVVVGWARELPKVNLKSDKTRATCVVRLKSSHRVPDGAARPFCIKCKLPVVQGGRITVEIFCSAAELVEMFHRTNEMSSFGVRGLYARVGNFLCITYRGEGSAAIYISPEVELAVGELIERYAPRPPMRQPSGPSATA